MREIGGYFELELNNYNNIYQYFPNSYFLNSGRHALEFILSGLENIETLYVPYFTCSVTLEPIERLGLKYEFYEIDERLEIKDISILKNLKTNDYIIYTNYFGIKDEYINRLIDSYDKTKIIIDAAQSLFYFNRNIEYIFYSPRKFIGIPDGGIALINNENLRNKYDKIFEDLKIDKSYLRCEHLLSRIDQGPTQGYKSFKQNSSVLSDKKMLSMSKLTKGLFNNVDIQLIKNQRRDNFHYLHNELKNLNELNFDLEKEVPLVYPFLYKAELKQTLIQNKIFVATYWPNVFEWCNKESLEYKLSNNLVNLPIDQRYSLLDMKYIVETIKKVL